MNLLKWFVVITCPECNFGGVPFSSKSRIVTCKNVDCKAKITRSRVQFLITEELKLQGKRL